MNHELRLPAPGAQVADILPSVAARLGLSGYEDMFGLPKARGYVVLVLDGLGARLLGKKAMEEITGTGQRRIITCGVPSTTSASLTSIGTGLTPSQHGVAGWTYRLNSGAVACPLHWSVRDDPQTTQPKPTIFERCEASGIRAIRAFEPRFVGSELTALGLRGIGLAAVREHDPITQQAAAIVAAAKEGGLVYAYDRRLDHTAHRHGIATVDWDAALRESIELVQRIRAGLPKDIQLIVTGDHGGLDIPGKTRVIIEDFSELTNGVALIAGEARFRHLYTDEPEAVAELWREFCRERAWVRTRDEAVAEGWFGELDPNVAGHFGDVVVAARGTWAFLSTQYRREWSLVGMHGSLTQAEMDVPFVIVGLDH